MDALPLFATAVGAVIALSGTLLTDIRRDRRQRDRDREQVRRETYVRFALALNTGHDGLRQVANSFTPDDERPAATNRALTDAGLYSARELLLMIATEPVAVAGEDVFLRLVDIRDVVREGATTASERYDEAYRRWSEAAWQFRMTVRSELGQSALTRLSEGDRQ